MQVNILRLRALPRIVEHVQWRPNAPAMPTFEDLTETERSTLMARIRKTDTKPELAVRRLAHAMGYRYRLHRKDLPGTPDLAFPGRKKVIYVNGCFWHQHGCKLGRKEPRTNTSYWLPKLKRNKARDKENQAAVRKMDWDSLVIWECQVKDVAKVQKRLRRFLG